MALAGRIHIPASGARDVLPSKPINRLKKVSATTTRVARVVSFVSLRTDTVDRLRATERLRIPFFWERLALSFILQFILHSINQSKQYDNCKNSRDDPY